MRSFGLVLAVSLVGRGVEIAVPQLFAILAML